MRTKPKQQIYCRISSIYRYQKPVLFALADLETFPDKRVINVNAYLQEQHLPEVQVLQNTSMHYRSEPSFLLHQRDNFCCNLIRYPTTIGKPGRAYTGNGDLGIQPLITNGF